MGLSVIGIGPGNEKYLTMEARDALDSCDVVIGYPLYLELINPLIEGKERYSTPMRKEIERCRIALGKAAEGRRVALVCSGDAGVYGMASLVYELAPEYPPLDIRIIPGITAALSGAALLGSPLGSDFAVISLSDLLTPPETIEARLAAAARGDFGICLYNPASAKRRGSLAKACDTVSRFRKADTVCGVVRNAGREGEEVLFTDLENLRGYEADMFTTIFIGNSKTSRVSGKMVSPRGYPLRAGMRRPPPSRGRDAPVLFVFAGTTEGRLFIEKFSKAAEAPFEMHVFTATGYGESLLREGAEDRPALPGGGEDILFHAGRLDAEGIFGEMLRYKPSCAVDCTHPHAVEVTRNIREACGRSGCGYFRIGRETGKAGDSGTENGVEYACSMEDAAGLLRPREGRVLLTTGTKGIEPFADGELRGRVCLRVLPMEESIRKCRALGFPAKNIICMQGPFSEEFNRSLLRETGASWLVTKDSGDEGGFQNKLEAARKEGAGVILLRRPDSASPEDRGARMEEVLSEVLSFLPKDPPA
ncbi:MAG: precorrin-3B C(17)-methyltransferase [Treponema sp.]|jgi:precorrin-3B C17-methyltransferase|nr:precorrin-3B C(17)-methyltransferase [Treponema sp.]